MKVYEYAYFIRYGSGSGIVIAESAEDAIKLLCENYPPPNNTVKELFPELELTEIDITKPRVFDHSYAE